MTGSAFSVMVVDVHQTTQDTASTRSSSSSSSSSSTSTTTVSMSNVRTIFKDHKYGYPGGVAGFGERPMQWAPSPSFEASGKESGEERLIFGTENTGFVHVVSVSVTSSSSSSSSSSASSSSSSSGVTDLTPALCDNQSWMVASDGALYTTHNCGDPATPSSSPSSSLGADALGIAAVYITGGAVTRTSIVDAAATTVVGMADGGAGVVELYPHRGQRRSTDGPNGLAYISCGYNRPCTVVVASRDGAPAISVSPSPGTAGFAAAAASFVEPLLVTMPSLDGQFTLHGQLFAPRHTAGGSSSGRSSGDSSSTSSSASPSAAGGAVLFTHGGCQRQMYAAMHYDADYAALYALNQYLAVALNMTVLSINYRGGVGYGVHFRACEGCGWQGAAEYNDVLTAGRWLQGRGAVNASRVALYGLSYGGLNTLQGLTRDSDVFAAGVANAPVFNFISRYEPTHSFTTIRTKSQHTVHTHLLAPLYMNASTHTQFSPQRAIRVVDGVNPLRSLTGPRDPLRVSIPPAGPSPGSGRPGVARCDPGENEVAVTYTGWGVGGGGGRPY